MALLQLIARLGLDNSQFNTKLGETEGRANIFSRRFSSSFTSGLTKIVTFGFLTGLVRNAIANYKEVEGLTQDTKDAMEELNSTAHEAWNMINAGIDGALGGLENFLSKLHDVASFFGIIGGAAAAPPTSGKIWDQPWWPFKWGQRNAQGKWAPFGTGPMPTPVEPSTPAEDIARMEKRLEFERKRVAQEEELAAAVDRNNLQEVSDEQRKIELIKRQQELLNAIQTGTAVKIAGKTYFGHAAEMEVQRLRGELFGLRPEIKILSIPVNPRDPLARIGGFTAGSEKIVTIQERIAKATEGTEKNTAQYTVRLGG